MNLIRPFLSWCTAQGIVTPLDVKVRRSDGSRYTVMKGDIDSSGDNTDIVNLIVCPLKACITASTSEELVDRLLFEKSMGDTSKYAPYISVLPDQSAFSNMPRFWSPERFERVIADGGYLAKIVAQDEQRVKSAPDPWALACVDSRTNILADGSCALTPMLDAVNHDASVEMSTKVKNDLLFLNVALELMTP